MNKPEVLNSGYETSNQQDLRTEGQTPDELIGNNKKILKWTTLENEIYAQALKDLLGEFEEEYLRRTKKVFVLISERIKTKTPDQCRSHHQKMMKHSKSIKNIIKRFLKTPKVEKKPKKVEEEPQSETFDLTPESSKINTERDTFEEDSLTPVMGFSMEPEENIFVEQESWELWLSL